MSERTTEGATPDRARFEAFFVAAALVAARPGEILGLKWPDLTLPEEKGDLGLAIICRTVSLTGGRVEIRERTKAGRGRNRRSRAVDLLPPVVAEETLTEKLVSADVRWDYLDEEGRSVERNGYRYVLRLEDAGPQICAVIATPPGR